MGTVVNKEHPSTGRTFARYTVRLLLGSPDRQVDYTVITCMGELKAAAMAALEQASHGEVPLNNVEVVKVERDYAPDPERDLLDYWEIA